MGDQLSVGVIGRSGAGLTTVSRALRGAGIAVACHPDDADVDVYVFVETLNADDRAALADAARPTVAVLNKADLAGFSDGGPMVLAARRCRQLRRETGVPVRPLCALLALAGTDPEVLDNALADLRTLAGGAAPSAQARMRLAADLDMVGIAVAVAGLREGAGRPAIAEMLWRVSGMGDVLTAIDLAAAALRYRRARGAARFAAALAVLEAAGAPAPMGADPLRQAVHWQRYACGPVSPLHGACARDVARGALRRWVAAGGRPAGLP